MTPQFGRPGSSNEPLPGRLGQAALPAAVIFQGRTLTRRQFVKCAAMATGAAVLGQGYETSAAEDASRLVDVNVSLGPWPLRRLPYDEPAPLARMLRAHGVVQAWAGSFDGLLHKDIPAVNQRLADNCRRHGRGLLLPFGSINPKLPGWENALEQCARVHKMPGIRLHPNYHGYRLDDPAFNKLLNLATGLGLIVQLALVMEDERMMHPLLRVEPVDTAPLAELVQNTPRLRLVLINALRTLRGQPLKKLLSAGNVFVEVSMLEGVGGIEGLLKQVPADRVLLGSHAPFFYFEAAQLKLKESRLSSGQLAAVAHQNAGRLIQK
jgi:predicted TIM-barrel fold metal-dependent hydrolase